jgi:hypothetical protein
MNNKLTVLLSMTILMLAVSFNASAAKPETYFEEGDWDFGVWHCDGYQVRGLQSYRYRDTLFFNRHGEPVRLAGHYLSTGTIYYNSVHGDIYIQEGPGENQQFGIDLTTGEERYSGLNFRITIPGIGPLYIDVGQWRWIDGELYRSGMTILPEEGTGSALCEALAP